MKLGYTRMFNRFIAVLLVVSMLPLAALATALPEKAQADGAYEIVSSTQAPEGYVPKNEVFEPTTTSGTTDNDAPVKVLLIEDVLPWSSYANQTVLGGICEYKKPPQKTS